NVNDFIVDDESAVDFDNISTKLQELGEDSNYGAQADPYWSRVLAQTSRFEQTGNIEKLLKQTKDWFGLLFVQKKTRKA
ncbi:MAG: hypothetical protein Q5533_04375, partial [Haemophilus haemolyticus]|nr:hypothetical protein [Haemophilus haemolyticus]